MKPFHILILLLFFVVILMVRDPKTTTAEITAGEQAFTGGVGAVAGGFLTKPKTR